MPKIRFVKRNADTVVKLSWNEVTVVAKTSPSLSEKEERER